MFKIKALWILLAIIVVCSCSGGREKQQMTILLERADSMNLSDVPMDTLYWVKNVYDYFIKEGETGERIYASYMLGCVYRDRKDATTALRYFKEAVSMADTTRTDCDYHLLSRIYGQMASLFWKLRIPNMAMESVKDASRFALKAGDTLNVITYYQFQADFYHILNRFDSALYISKKAEKLYENHGYKEYSARTLPIVIDIHLRNNQFKEAAEALRKYEGESGLFENGEIKEGYQGYYVYKAQYFEGINAYDSALCYYKKILSYKDNNADLLVEAYKGLMSMYHKLNKADSLSKYALLLASTTDSMNVENAANELIQMQSVYNYKEFENVAIEKSEETKMYKIYIYIISLAAICIILAIAYFVRQWRRKIRKRLIEENKQYTYYLQQYKQSLTELKLLKKDSEEYRKKKEQDIQNLQQTLSLFQNDKSRPESWDIEHSLINSPIIERLHELANKGKYASSIEWEDLTSTISKSMPSFYNFISQENAHLTEKEIYLCILIRLRFIRSEYPILLNLTTQRITNMRADINAKLFNQKGVKGLDANIGAIN